MSNAQLYEAEFYRQYIGDTQLVTADGAVHWSTPLVQGRYALACAETALYVRQGGAGISVGPSDFLLEQGDLFFVNADDVNSNRIAAMTATGLGGSLRITRVDALTGFAPAGLALHQDQYFYQFIGPTIAVAVGNVSTASAALTAPGRYLLRATDSDVYLKQGSAPVADANQFFLSAGQGFFMNVDDANGNVVAVLDAGGLGGSLLVTRLDSV